jgi:hypothetical protein
VKGIPHARSLGSRQCEHSGVQYLSFLPALQFESMFGVRKRAEAERPAFTNDITTPPQVVSQFDSVAASLLRQVAAQSRLYIKPGRLHAARCHLFLPPIQI